MRDTGISRYFTLNIFSSSYQTLQAVWRPYRSLPTDLVPVHKSHQPVSLCFVRPTLRIRIIHHHDEESAFVIMTNRTPSQGIGPGRGC